MWFVTIRQMTTGKTFEPLMMQIYHSCVLISHMEQYVFSAWSWHRPQLRTQFAVNSFSERHTWAHKHPHSCGNPLPINRCGAGPVISVSSQLLSACCLAETGLMLNGTLFVQQLCQVPVSWHRRDQLAEPLHRARERKKGLERRRWVRMKTGWGGERSGWRTRRI